MAQLGFFGDVRGRMVETGLSVDLSGGAGEIVGGVAKLADVWNGGDQKRERTAKAQRDEAKYEAQAAADALALAKLQAQAPPPSVSMSYGAVPSGSGFMAWLGTPSYLGFPRGVWAAAAGGAALLIVSAVMK